MQSDDAGEYVCYAKNPVGSVESSARLIVNSPPVFTKFPQNLRLNTGKTAVFECEAIGQPTPGIFWSKEGDQVNREWQKHLIIIFSYLHSSLDWFHRMVEYK